MSRLAAPFVGLVVTAVLTPALIRALRHWRIVDTPGERSSHSVDTPRGGGLAVLAGLAAALAFAPRTRPVVAVVAVALAFGAVGALEDLRGASPLARFCLQLAAAAAGVALWRPAQAGAAVAAVLIVVAYANSFNFMDGINGISVAQVVVAALAYAALARRADDRPLTVCALVLAACALGFLPWNFPRAMLFLGDAGSYALGGALAMLGLALLRADQPVEAIAAPLLLYFADTGTTLLRRVRRGEAWYLPHRTHTYQRLTDRGFSHARVTGIVTAVILTCTLLGAVSLFASMSMRLVADAAIAVTLFAYLQMPALLRRAGEPA